MLFRFVLLILLLIVFGTSQAQVYINEVVSSGISGLKDEDGLPSDWFELYNASSTPVNLEGFVVSDKLTDPAEGWAFPKVEIGAKSHLLVFASGKDRSIFSLHQKTVISEGDLWQYLIPIEKLAENWRMPSYNASNWQTGKSGFGFGDNDDKTVLNITNSLYIRKEFQVSNVQNIKRLLFHVDYDDAFAVFINGTLVTKANVDFNNDDYEDALVTDQHEAQMFQGAKPSEYVVNNPSDYLINGTNVIAIQGYNISETSTDFTLIPFLTLASTEYTSTEVPMFINVAKGNLHTNFSIDKNGETVYLFNKEKLLIDSLLVPELLPDVSYGRYPDGNANWTYYTTPTPNKANSNPVNEIRRDSIVFSQAPGFYPKAIQLKLSTTTPNGEIRFTTDGSEPTANSSKYTQALNIGESQAIRAASFLNGTISSRVFTSTYFIAENHSLPVVSISTDPKNLYDYNEGILVEGPNAQTNDPHYGANYWMDWEKPINVEVFDQAGKMQINQQAGVKVAGNWSRMKPQKTLALFARKQYGKEDFDYPFFHDKPTKEYGSLLLRNSGNDWNYTMLRDGFASEIAKNMNIDRLAYQPSVVYLNGSYWGILNMREKPNEGYFENNYDIEEEELSVLENQNEIVYGNNTDFLDMLSFLKKNTLVADDDFAQITDRIDIDCFIDYQILQIFIYNGDWPGNNIKYWRSNQQNSKWRWLLFDTDFGFSLYDYNNNANGLNFATATNGPNWPNPPWSTLLFRKMLENEQFQHRFINRFADLMNSTFEGQHLNALLDSLSLNIDAEIGRHSEQWGRSYQHWESNINVIRNFNNERSENVRSHIVDFFMLDRTCEVDIQVSGNNGGTVLVNTLHVKDFPFYGTYFSNVPIPLKALPNPGYRFVRWELGNSSTKPEIEVTLTGDISLRAVFEPVVSMEKNIVINEINYKSEDGYDSGDWIELHNPTNQTIDLGNWVLADNNVVNGFTFPAGTYLYPESYLVVCANSVKFKKAHQEVKNTIGDMEFGLSSSGDMVSLYDNGGNLIDYVNYEAVAPWPTQPQTTASTLMLSNPVNDNSIAQSWQPGPLGGTPGKANFVIDAITTIAQNTPKPVCFPSVFSDYTTLKLAGIKAETYRIKLMDTRGRVIKTLDGSFSSTGNYYIELFADAGFYPKGIYFVQVKTEKTSETIKVVKQ